MQLELIYNASLDPAQVSISNVFKNGQFLLFNTPNLPSNQGIEIGFALVVYIPISLTQTIKKDVALPSFEFVGTLSSFTVIEIPREYSESGYQMYCAFNSSISVNSFQVYAVCSSVTQESLNQEILDLQNSVANLQTQVTELTAIVNQLLVADTAIETIVNKVIPLLETAIPLLLAGV